MTEPTNHSPAGHGLELYTVDATVTAKISAEQTGGLYELFEVDAPRGPAAPPHREPWTKAFYLLRGRMSVQVDDTTYDVGPGSSVMVPAGAVNTFTVLTPTVTFLTFCLGDGMGRFFADLDRSAPRDRPLDELVPVLLAATERHGVTLAAAATS